MPPAVQGTKHTQSTNNTRARAHANQESQRIAACAFHSRRIRSGHTHIRHIYRLPGRPLSLNLRWNHALLAPRVGVSVRRRSRSSMSMPLPALASAVRSSSGGRACAPTLRPVFGWLDPCLALALAMNSGGSFTAALGRRDSAGDTDMDGGSDAGALLGVETSSMLGSAVSARGSSQGWLFLSPRSSCDLCGGMDERGESPGGALRFGEEGSTDPRRPRRPPCLPTPDLCGPPRGGTLDSRVAGDRGIATGAAGLGTLRDGGGEGGGGGERSTTLRGVSIELSIQMRFCWWSTDSSRSRCAGRMGEEYSSDDMCARGRDSLMLGSGAVFAYLYFAGRARASHGRNCQTCPLQRCEVLKLGELLGHSSSSSAPSGRG